MPNRFDDLVWLESDAIHYSAHLGTTLNHMGILGGFASIMKATRIVMNILN